MMLDIILNKLDDIERKENVKIIYAVESGSRAWGFDSQDSDYDVRFIYVRPLNDYLSLENIKDTIDYELNDVFDINGWDLKKALKLLYKSNPTLYEWKASPIVYKKTMEWDMICLLYTSSITHHRNLSIFLLKMKKEIELKSYNQSF